MRKIALRGLLGRKKETFLLLNVIFLSFFFVTLATTLSASSEVNKAKVRQDYFGSYQYAYVNKPYAETNSFLENADKSATVRILGKDPRAGIIGSLSEDALSLSNIKLREGTLPKAPEEIVIEYDRLSYFPEGLKIGDELLLQVTQNLITPDFYQIMDDLDRLLAADPQAPKPLIKEDFRQFMKQYETEDPLLFNNGFYREYLAKKYQETTHYGWFKDGSEPFTESVGGTTIQTYTRSYTFFIGQKQYPVAYQQTLMAQKSFKLVGIIETYSDHWSIDQSYLPNAFVTEAAAVTILDHGLLKSEGPHLKEPTDLSNLLFTSSRPLEAEGDLIVNRLAYPDLNNRQGEVIRLLILAVLFLVTVFSIFQIYQTQLKKRTRKLVLMQAIGATGKQIRHLLLWELIITILIALPLGIVLGLLTSKLVLILQASRIGSLSTITIDPLWLIVGILGSVISIIFGVLFPLKKAIKVPLTGSMEVTDKKVRASVRQTLDPRKLRHRLDTAGIEKRHRLYLRKQRLMTLFLYSFIAGLVFVSLYLYHASYETYRQSVLNTDLSDYQFQNAAIMRPRAEQEVLSDLNTLQGVTDVYVVSRAPKVSLPTNGRADEILEAFLQVLPAELQSEFYDETNDAYLMDFYSVPEDSPVLEKLLQDRKFDLQAFKAGKTAIAILPRTVFPASFHPESDLSFLNSLPREQMISKVLEKQGMVFSFDPLDQDLGRLPKGLADQPTIAPFIKTKTISEKSSVGIRTFSFQVAAVVSSFEPTYPFSLNRKGPVFLVSETALREIVPLYRHAGRLSQSQLKEVKEANGEEYFGETNFYVSLSTGNPSKDYIEAKRLAIKNDLRFIDHTKFKNDQYANSTQRALIILLFAVTVVIVALQIQFMNARSRIEQERDRIGILQSIGVRERDLIRNSWKEAARFGIVSIMLAHLMTTITLFFVVLTREQTLLRGFFNSLLHELRGYPSEFHLMLTGVLFLLILLSYALPLRRILRNQPVENIRSQR